MQRVHFQAISWFVNVGLLPEQPEGPHSPIPLLQLQAQYGEKRRQLARAGTGGCHGKPELMVDILCRDIGDDLIKSFQKSGGTGTYPPPSLHSLITIFLSESPAPAKLRLVQYFFLDLAHLLNQDLHPELVDSLIKFPSAFSLPPSIIKLTQAFWLLDHEDWEDSVSIMLDPEPSSSPCLPRVSTASLSSTRGAIQEAFTFQRKRRSSNLLPLFYVKAEELGKLDSVLQLSLTTQEEREFVSFLQSSRRQDS